MPTALHSCELGNELGFDNSTFSLSFPNECVKRGRKLDLTASLFLFACLLVLCVVRFLTQRVHYLLLEEDENEEDEEGGEEDEGGRGSSGRPPPPESCSSELLWRLLRTVRKIPPSFTTPRQPIP